MIFQSPQTASGNLSELMVAEELVRRGYPVLTPLTEAMLAYDMLMQAEQSRFVRLQIRTAIRPPRYTQDARESTWQVSITKASGDVFTETAADFLIAVLQEIRKFYIFPVSHLRYCGTSIILKPDEKPTKKLDPEQFLEKWDLLLATRPYSYAIRYDPGENNEELMRALDK